MKYKVGDHVRIKSLGWYNENKDKNGNVDCGEIMTIRTIWEDDKCYKMNDSGWNWTDEMIEGLVEDEMIDLTSVVMETIEEKTIQNALYYGYNLPDGYQFVDENGNVINTTKIVLEKKKPKYPRSYEECCDILQIEHTFELNGLTIGEETLFKSFIHLKRCRDAYWKIAGEEMGLGKPWEPGWCNEKIKYCLVYIPIYGGICKRQHSDTKHILAFPTEEMRDAYYETFKELIETCKELL